MSQHVDCISQPHDSGSNVFCRSKKGAVEPFFHFLMFPHQRRIGESMTQGRLWFPCQTQRSSFNASSTPEIRSSQPLYMIQMQTSLAIPTSFYVWTHLSSGQTVSTERLAGMAVSPSQISSTPDTGFSSRILCQLQCLILSESTQTRARSQKTKGSKIRTPRQASVRDKDATRSPSTSPRGGRQL